jgi:hypothetical protein
MINSYPSTPPPHVTIVNKSTHASLSHTPHIQMTEQELPVEEFGQNDNFWLFGYGFVLAMITHEMELLTVTQESDMETTATLRYAACLAP